MNSHRLKQLRLARGLSLEELAAALGGIVTRQALWKYEQGSAKPSLAVASKLAAVLGTKSIYLLEEPQVNVEYIAYRKKSDMTKAERDRVESLVCLSLEERIRLQDRIRSADSALPSIEPYAIGSVDDAEEAALQLRERWSLGTAAIASVTAACEDHHIHVIEIDADRKFDGISALARDQVGSIVAAAIVIRKGIPGERQRLDVAHELGHLVLKVPEGVDEEKAAFRFGSAFLLPADAVRREVGVRRANIAIPELLMLKQSFGVSIQAILYRLKVLDVIGESHYKSWCIRINKLGYRTNEPNPLRPEEPTWLRRTVLHGLSEGLLTRSEAEQLTGIDQATVDMSRSISGPMSMTGLSVAERRQLLAEQARSMVSYYEESKDAEDLGGGDFIEY